jgi:hypothetical protein
MSDQLTLEEFMDTFAPKSERVIIPQPILADLESKIRDPLLKILAIWKNLQFIMHIEILNFIFNSERLIAEETAKEEDLIISVKNYKAASFFHRLCNKDPSETLQACSKKLDNLNEVLEDFSTSQTFIEKHSLTKVNYDLVKNIVSIEYKDINRDLLL